MIDNLDLDVCSSSRSGSRTSPRLLVNLQQFITGLSRDINPILGSLGSINSLNTKTACCSRPGCR